MSGSTKYGTGSLNTNTGDNNSAFGNYAAYNNTDASCNTAIGSNALFNNTNAPHNTAIGAGAMFYNTTGQLNTAVGSSALEGPVPAASVGNQNVAIGAQALYSNEGDNNVGVGYQSLLNNTTGQQNIAIGSSAGRDLSGNSNFNTFLGFNTDISSNTLTYNNSTALGYNSTIDASNQIVLGTSTENVKIPGSYVGIGGVYNLSGSPHVYNLDVSGNINFSGDLYKNGFIYDASGGSSQWSNGTGSSIYYNTGNVGIGTNSPSYVLDVDGSANITLSNASNTNPNLTLSGGVSSVSGAYLQLLGSGNTGENVGINLDTFKRSNFGGTPATTIRSIDNGGYSGNLEFLTANTTGTQVDVSNNPQSVSMIIKPQATGNAFVGIGTIDPSYNLDVSGILQVQDGTFDPIYSTYLHGLNVSASKFYYNSKTPTDIESFKIELDGANCLIYKGTQSNTAVIPNPFSTQDASATVIQNDGTYGGIALVSTSTYIYVNNGSPPRVGIMTSNPQYTLDVSGNVNATQYNTPSDYRIKENVTQLDGKFIVDKLNPVTYLNKKSDKQDIGLIAHELQEIYPELVNGEKDGEQLQSVNYTGLIPILIKEIKELKERVKILEERN